MLINEACLVSAHQGITWKKGRKTNVCVSVSEFMAVCTAP